MEKKILCGSARGLAEIIDDISTAFDMFKPEMKNFERYVSKKIEEANKYFTSDGYELYEVESEDE